MSNKAKKKQGLQPKLRFPKFRGGEDWKETALQLIAMPVSDKAKESSQENILTLSAEQGLIQQSKYFGKKIAGENIERYTKILINDFVYNDRITSLSNYGTIKRLFRYESGAVSPIYKCFRFNKDEIPSFWENYFESDAHESQLHNLVNEGARAGRFNISIQKFLSTLVLRPKQEEQQKIADCLTSIDDLITAQSQKLDALKDHKKGLMQQLFPVEGKLLPKVRFPEFAGVENWNSNIFAELYSFKTTNSLSRDKLNHENGIVKNIHYGDIHTKFNALFDIEKEHVPLINESENIKKQKQDSFCIEGDMIFADASENLDDVGKSIEIVNLNNERLLSGLHTLLARQKNEKFVVGFGGYLFQSNLIRSQIKKQAQGAKVLGISSGRLSAIEVCYPSNKKEQKKIADCLSSIDELIAAERKKLDVLKNHKKGLMQQLFPSLSEIQG